MKNSELVLLAVPWSSLLDRFGGIQSKHRYKNYSFKKVSANRSSLYVLL